MLYPLSLDRDKILDREQRDDEALSPRQEAPVTFYCPERGAGAQAERAERGFGY